MNIKEATGNALLLTQIKVEEADSRFSTTVESNSVVYSIDFAGPETPFNEGDLVLLKPHAASQVWFDGHCYYYATDEEVIAVVTEDKKSE